MSRQNKFGVYVIKKGKKRPLTTPVIYRKDINQIAKEVANATGQESTEIIGKKRNEDIMTAKHLFRFLCLKEGYNLKEVADYCGVHYSSVISSRQFIEDMISIKDDTILELFKKLNYE